MTPTQKLIEAAEAVKLPDFVYGHETTEHEKLIPLNCVLGYKALLIDTLREAVRGLREAGEPAAPLSGWTIRRHADAIEVRSPTGNAAAVRPYENDPRTIPSALLYELAATLIAAPPSPAPQPDEAAMERAHNAGFVEASRIVGPQIERMREAPLKCKTCALPTEVRDLVNATLRTTPATTAPQPAQDGGEVVAHEVRADGKTVRVDRWEVGIRRIVALLWGNRREFEVDEVVEAVRGLVPQPFNEGDDEGLVRAVLATPASAPPAGDPPAPAAAREVVDVLARCIAGIDHLAELARQWEPDHSNGSDRRGWVLAKDARDDAERLRAALAAADAQRAQESGE